MDVLKINKNKRKGVRIYRKNVYLLKIYIKKETISNFNK